MANNVLPLTDENFKEVVQKSELPVLVDFWADWCGPCKMIAPEVEKLADEYQGKMAVYKLDVDECKAIPGELGVMSIPTLSLFIDGKEVERAVGFRKYHEIVTLIQKHF